MELFGQQYEEVHADLDRIAIAEVEREAEVNAGNSVTVDKSKGKKGKEGKFAKPRHWLTYFPPLAIVSLLKCLCQIFHA